MRRVEQLISQIRRQSDNEDISESATDSGVTDQGISKEEIVCYLNDAQSRMQSRLLFEIPDLRRFDTSVTTTPVAGQQAYTLGDEENEPVGGEMIRRVQYTPSGFARDYYDLERRTLEELTEDTSNDPYDYDVRNGEVLISPIPSVASGTLRFTFPRRLDALDLRRAQIATVNSSGGYYTSLVLESPPAPDPILQDESFFICVNSKHGVVNYYNAEVDNYDENGLLLTLASSSSPTANGTISVGDWITYGKFTTTHSKLPQECERYLIAYAAWKLLKRDSNAEDATAQESEVSVMEADLIDLFRNLNRGFENMVAVNSFYTI